MAGRRCHASDRAHRRACGEAERERRLLRAARRGDSGAREQLVVSHLTLVRGVASRYLGLGLPFDDLVQEGSLGLLEAIDRFDPDRGTDFGAYARFRVRRAIRNALTDQGRLIRLPRHIVERQRALARAEERFAADGGRMPSPAELAATTGLPVSAVVEARRAATAPLSLDVPATPDGATLESVIADEAAPDPALEAMRDERSSRLATAVAALPTRRREVVERSFGLGERPHELADVAAAMHVSPQRVRSITNSALHELHTGLLAAGMTD